MVWYELLVSMLAGMVFILLAVALGGWLVFRAKTITMPAPFIGGVKKDRGVHSYAGDLFNDAPEVLDDELTPAAARLRSQRMEPEAIKETVLSMVRGKK